MKKLLLKYKETPSDKMCVKCYNYYNKHIMSAVLLDEEHAEIMVSVIRHYRKLKGE